jgi:hypothetical protein
MATVNRRIAEYWERRARQADEEFREAIAAGRSEEFVDRLMTCFELTDKAFRSRARVDNPR